MVQGRSEVNGPCVTRGQKKEKETGKREFLLLCAPRARWPQSQPGALCLGAAPPRPDVSCPALEECLVCGWHGACLAVRMTQIPSWRLPAQAAQAVPLACIDGAGGSLSRMEAREDGCLCVYPLSLSLPRHRGGRGRCEGCIAGLQFNPM